MVLSQSILQCAVILLPTVLVSFLAIRRIKRQKKDRRNPFPEGDLKRQPGQNLLEEMEELDSKLYDEIAIMVAGPVILALTYFQFQQNATDAQWIYFLMVGLSVIIALIFGYRARKLVEQWSDYRLGYQGEVYVAQHMDTLIKEGYSIHHDLEFENFNIDHVIVGTTGIYVVETKTKRKKKGESNAHEVAHDGCKLVFSDGAFHVTALEQTKRNAEHLHNLIRSKLGLLIPVYPILTYPGWMVTRKGKGDVNVINPKELTNSLRYFKDARLEPTTLRQINHFIENLPR